AAMPLEHRDRLVQAGIDGRHGRRLDYGGGGPPDAVAERDQVVHRGLALSVADRDEVGEGRHRVWIAARDGRHQGIMERLEVGEQGLADDLVVAVLEGRVEVERSIERASSEARAAALEGGGRGGIPGAQVAWRETEAGVAHGGESTVRPPPTPVRW